MKASSTALNHIKKYEGCQMESYEDSNGRWAVGYGQTGPQITKGLRITQLEADAFLRNHVERVQEDISRLVKVKLTQNQFDALVGLVYNIGLGAFSSSTLLKKINGDKMEEAAQEILKWTHSQGKELPGLKNRRQDEYYLFTV